MAVLAPMGISSDTLAGLGAVMGMPITDQEVSDTFTVVAASIRDEGSPVASDPITERGACLLLRELAGDSTAEELARSSSRFALFSDVLDTLRARPEPVSTKQHAAASIGRMAVLLHEMPIDKLQRQAAGCARDEHPIANLRDTLQRIWGDSRNFNKGLIIMSQTMRDMWHGERASERLDGLLPHVRWSLYWEEQEEPELPPYGGLFRLPSNTDQMPLTQKMVRAIIDARSKEKGVPPEELKVVVSFHGGNLMEVMMWLETGAQVIAADTSTFAGLKLRRWLRQRGHDRLPPNLKMMNPYWRRNPRGDVVTASHPHISVWSPFGAPTRRITSYGMEDAIYIVQADFSDRFVDPFSEDPDYDVLLEARPDQHHYFFPSWFLVNTRREKKLAVFTPKREK